MAKIQIKSMKLTPFGEEYFNREQLLALFCTNQHLLSVGEKRIAMCERKNALRCAKEKFLCLKSEVSDNIR